jgi:hypothetical protein
MCGLSCKRTALIWSGLRPAPGHPCTGQNAMAHGAYTEVVER